MPQEVDVRPVPVDKLMTLPETALEARIARVTVLLGEYEAHVNALLTDLETAQRTHGYLQKELAQTELALQLSRGDVVRVICPGCRGTGMLASDVLSGRVRQTGSAFESAPFKGPPVVEDRDKCKQCQGLRWVIMERFKG